MFKAGKSQDGLEQTNCMMDFLDSNHPNDDHIFFFDNAKTHTACWPNALSAWHMPLKPSTSHVANWLCSEKNSDGTSTKIPMQDGKFIDGSAQLLYFLADHPQAGLFKGMKIIIQECCAHRSLLPDPMQLCVQCVEFKCVPGCTDCCCQCILFSEPDFVAQKSKLKELIE